ncbi:MAG: hypothetical protein OHK93_004339 [Ramalina farinacea]|uniref:Inositol-1-monophosphatase n=1 Tax=Ramalina farinacea TaxID=258253 RepID=A0AA43QGK9_9LECA|nr:hypothetical protein [Ramalina farinacea]
MPEPEPNLQEIHDVLFDIALEAGDMITSANPSSVDTKKNSLTMSPSRHPASDLVTETDKAVEEFVFGHLRSKYPSYALLGEETSHTGTLTPAPTFILDPIDGTTNFVHAHPYISISLAFSLNLRPVVGVVYNPFTQQIYHAITGNGAFLTAPCIPSSKPPRPGSATANEQKKVEAHYTTTQLPLQQPLRPWGKLDTCLLAVEWGNERSGANWETKLHTFAGLAGDSTTKGKMVHSLRSLGSAALNMCAVARGDLDAYWEGGCWAWDVAAGWVVVTEAGGRVVGGNPGEWEPRVDARRYLVVRAGEEGKGQEGGLIEEVWGVMGDGRRLEY